MRVGAAVVFACLGCGRVGFDAVPDSVVAPPPDGAGPPSLATQIANALPCETDVTLASSPQADELHWLDNGNAQAIVVLQHLDATHHELRVFPLAITAGAVTTPGFSTFYAAPDMWGLGIAPVAGGYSVAVTDLSTGIAHVLALDANFTRLSDTPIATLGYATVPLARSTAGALVIGHGSSGGIAAAALDAALQPTGTVTSIDGATDANPSIFANGADFLVAWEDSNGGACSVARVALDGTVLAGPATYSPMGATACGHAYAMPLSGGKIMLAMLDVTDSSSPVAYATMTDASLSAASLISIGDPDSIITGMLAAGTDDYVSVRTTGDSRVIKVVAGGGISPLGGDFGLNGNDADTETLASVAGALVHVRTESGQLELRKLCR